MPIIPLSASNVYSPLRSRFMNTLINWIKWLIGLAQPGNLQALASMSGHAWVSYLILSAIVFSETGLLVGFFLPGDSLLFAAGLLSSQDVFDVSLLIVTLSVAAVVGDAVNYYVGLQMGEYVFERGRLRFVKHSHLLAAKAFYERHGGKAIILARFVPLVRTFTPFVAGVARMSYARFVVYNVIGGIGWVTSMTLCGYWLGQIAWIRDHFELVVMAIVFVSVLPVVGGVAKHWFSSAKPGQSDKVPVGAEAGEGHEP
jgi:membrane-associated protein